MNERCHAYIKYLPIESVCNALGNSIGGSELIKVLNQGRVEDELAVLCVKLAQDGAIFRTDDGVALCFNKRDCQEIFVQEEKVPFMGEVKLVWQ